TMGAKKSTVWTSARSSDSRKTPASSNVSEPTRRRASIWRGSGASTWNRSPGPILDAQPAHLANAVSRNNSSRVLEVLMTASGETRLTLRLRHLGHNFDLHAGAARERGDLHRRARGPRAAQVPRVRVVERGEIGQVEQEDRRFDDVLPAGARGGEHGGEILHHAVGLLRDVAVQELAAGGVERDLSGGEQQLAGAHALRVRADGGGCVRRRDGREGHVRLRWKRCVGGSESAPGSSPGAPSRTVLGCFVPLF